VFGYWRRRSDCQFVLLTTSVVVTTITSNTGTYFHNLHLLHANLSRKFAPGTVRELTANCFNKSKSKSHCDWRSVSQSVILGVEPHLWLITRYLLLFDSYGLVFVGRPLWREDGSVLYAAGSSQGSLSRVRVPWYSRPYLTVSELTLSFSSTPTTRGVTVEAFDPASTRILALISGDGLRITPGHGPHRKQSLLRYSRWRVYRADA
jgi:hypothetical protein